MKTTLIGFCVALAAGEAQAISRYVSTSKTCAEIRSIIQSEGIAAMEWRSPASGARRYGNFIANRRYCSSDEGTEEDFVPASDRQYCPVRKCVDMDLGGG